MKYKKSVPFVQKKEIGSDRFGSDDKKSNNLVKLIKLILLYPKIEFLLKELKYSKDQVDDSLKNRKYDEIMATYMLLGTKSPEV